MKFDIACCLIKICKLYFYIFKNKDIITIMKCNFFIDSAYIGKAN